MNAVTVHLGDMRQFNNSASHYSLHSAHTILAPPPLAFRLRSAVHPYIEHGSESAHKTYSIAASSTSVSGRNQLYRTSRPDLPTDIQWELISSVEFHVPFKFGAVVIIIIIIKEIYIAPFRHAPKALCKKMVKC